MMKENSVYRELLSKINEMRVIDTHEHLIPEKTRLDSKVDFFNIALNNYLCSDLISAGMNRGDMELLQGYGTDLETKIRLFMPFWKKASNTSYSRAIKIAVKDLYGTDEINEDTLPELNRRIIEFNKPGIYKKILNEKLNIEFCVWDSFVKDPSGDDFFKLALRLDDIVGVSGKEDIAALEEKFKISIDSPSVLEDIFEICITSLKTKQLVALKCALAYERTLEFDPVSRTEAVLAMDKIIRGRFLESDVKILQDYLMFSLAEKASWHNLTLQIHTGLQEGNGNIIRNANPALLSNLIINNPNTRFDLFHGGFPYGGEMSVMAKYFPNVYLDMAWLHIISPEYTKRYLSQWLDTVPVNKILGFGGDYSFAEGVYGHLVMAKENVAHVLTEKVISGDFTMNEAAEYARMMFYDNANELFHVRR